MKQEINFPPQITVYLTLLDEYNQLIRIKHKTESQLMAIRELTKEMTHRRTNLTIKQLDVIRSVQRINALQRSKFDPNLIAIEIDIEWAKIEHALDKIDFIELSKRLQILEKRKYSDGIDFAYNLTIIENQKANR